MKKFTAILLTVIMVASLFTSCSNSIAPNIDETVRVSFDEATSRSLTASLENFVKGDYLWKYAAQKNAADGTGLTSGATSSYDEAGALWINGEDEQGNRIKGLGSVAGFSQGIWDFKLFAYKLVGSDYKLAYLGETTGVALKKGSANTVTVTVSPVVGDEGTLIIANTITLTPAKGSDTPSENLTKVYTVTALGSTAAFSPTTGTNQWTLDPGAYKINVDFVKDGFTYASGSVVATVYSNITTTVSGSLAELVTKAEFDSDINPDVMNKEAVSSEVKYSNLTGESASDVTLSESTNKVSATVPAPAAAQVIKDVLGSNTDNSSVELSLRVDTVEATNSSITLEIGMQATVTQKDTSNNVVSQTIKEVKELKGSNNEAVISTVTVQLQTGLTNVNVFHNNSTVPMIDLDSENDEKEGAYYNAQSGKLTIRTSSFSPFAVTYDAPTYIAEMNGVKYTSVQAAINAAPNNVSTYGKYTTITLLNNVTAGPSFGFPDSMRDARKKILIDLNGNTYTFKSPAMGSVGYQSQAMHLAAGNILMVKNGTLDVAIDNSEIKMLIQNYCNLYLDNVIVDGTNLCGSYCYTLSNCNGKAIIQHNTKIIAKENGVAFDVWYSESYPDGVYVAFYSDFNGLVSGIIEYKRAAGASEENQIKKSFIEFNGSGKIDSVLVTDCSKPNIKIQSNISLDTKDILGFADGNGTADNPYIISTTEQFYRIGWFKGVKKNFKLNTNLDFTNEHNNNFIVSLLYGCLDGNKHSIKFSKESEPLYLFEKIKYGEIKNLVVDISGTNSAIAHYTETSTTTFNQVKVTGDLVFTGNCGPYVIYAKNNVTFNQCEMAANITGTGDKTSYNSAFVGYLNTSKPQLTFEDCKLSGSISCGSAAIFVGNNSQAKETKITVNGLFSIGEGAKIRSTYTGSDAYKFNGAIAVPNSNPTSVIVNDTTYTIDQLVELKSNVFGDCFEFGPNDASLSLKKNEQGTFTITKADKEGVTKYVVSLGVYSRLEGVGTLRQYVTEVINASDSETYTTKLKDLKFVDSIWLDSHKDAKEGELSKNKIYTVDSESYYMLPSNDQYNVGGTPLGAQMYSVTAYNGDTIVASCGLSN